MAGWTQTSPRLSGRAEETTPSRVIKVLFIGESPPSNGGFFYYGSNNLLLHMRTGR
jgi:hypothetical protein